MSIRAEMIDTAYQLLRSGQRPTADALVASCGGSKATAVAALSEFWSNHLPRLLPSAISAVGDGPPETVMALASEVWQRALEFAHKELEAKTVAALAEAENIKEQLAQEREALDKEHELMAEATRKAEQGAEEARAQLVSLRAQHAETVAMNGSLLTEREGNQRLLAEKTADTTRLSDALTALTAERTALLERHQQALDGAKREFEARLEELRRVSAERATELKGIYTESESRLRVDLDAARTELAKVRQDAVKAREGWEGRLEAERVRASRELTDRLAEARAETERQVGPLRELLLRLGATSAPATPEGR